MDEHKQREDANLHHFEELQVPELSTFTQHSSIVDAPTPVEPFVSSESLSPEPPASQQKSVADAPTIVFKTSVGEPIKDADAPTTVIPSVHGMGMDDAVEPVPSTLPMQDNHVEETVALGNPMPAAQSSGQSQPIQFDQSAESAVTTEDVTTDGDVVNTFGDFPPINFPASIYDETTKADGKGNDVPVVKPLGAGDQPEYQSADGSGAITPQEALAGEPDYTSALVAEQPKPKRNPWVIVGIVTAVVILIALALGGWSYYNSLKNDRVHASALALCNDSRTKYNKASSALQDALNATKDAQAVTADAVADGSTVDALKQAVETANGLRQAQNCLYIASTDQLNAAAQGNQALIGKVNDSASAVTNAATAVTDSQKAKTVNDAKSALGNEITAAQTLLDGSNGAVTDEATRTALQNALNDATAVLGQTDPDPSALQSAVTALQNAEKAVQASKDAYTAQQEAARRTQQQNAQNSGNDSSDSSDSSDSGSDSRRSDSSSNGSGNRGGSTGGSTGGAQTTTPPSSPAPEPSSPEPSSPEPSSPEPSSPAPEPSSPEPSSPEPSSPEPSSPEPSSPEPSSPEPGTPGTSGDGDGGSGASEGGNESPVPGVEG